MKQIRFAPTAELDLLEVWLYLANEQSVEVADRVQDQITRKLSLVAGQSQMGEVYRAKVRRTLSGPYVIYYRPDEEEILVVRIFHGARDHGPLLDEE